MPSAVQTRVAPVQLDLFPFFKEPDPLPTSKGAEPHQTVRYIEPPLPPATNLPPLPPAVSSSPVPSPTTPIVAEREAPPQPTQHELAVETPAPPTAPTPTKAESRPARAKGKRKVKPYWPDPKTIVSSLCPRIAEGDAEDVVPEDPQLTLIDEGGEAEQPRDMIFKADDPLEVKLAKLMFHRCTHDLNYKLKVEVDADVQADIFGAPPPDKSKAERWINKVNALIWVYALNPGEVLVSFDWVCDAMGHDPEKFRRIVARIAGNDIKRTIKLIASTDKDYARFCEDKVSDYLVVSDWQQY